MPQPDVIVVDRLVKRYGRRPAVREASFSIGAGEVVGLLGPNGSGKSTIVRILTGFLPPSAGAARIQGFDVVRDSLAVRAYIGYVPEDAPVYDGMRVGEFLWFMAEIKGLSGKAAHAAVGSACERLALGSVLNVGIGKLSRGYRQRVAIAQALLNDPPILVFDEPTNALDAYQVIAVRELIRSFAGTRTILVASHVLTEIEKIATRVMILLDGKLLTADAKAEAQYALGYRLRVAGPSQEVIAALGKTPGVLSAEIDASATQQGHSLLDGIYLVRAAEQRPGIAAEMARSVVEEGLSLIELTEVKPDLERVFLDLTRHAAEARTA
jgi:ABC-2 type transport system ATP-binding protein